MKTIATKRVAALLLAATMGMSIFAGCSNNPSTKSPGSGSESTGTGAKSHLTAIINANNPMTLEPDEMPSVQDVEAKTGVDVEWEVVRTGWEDRKMLELAGGELPDMIFGNRVFSASDVIKNKDLFTDLTPYLDQMPNVQKMFEEEPALKNLVTMEDGSIYFLPSRMPLRPKSLSCVFINQKWLDTLNLKMPTTTDELVEVLKAFRDKDPNGNGEKDEIPMIGNGTIWNNNTLTTLMGAFGITINEFSDEMLMVRDGKLEFVPAMKEYKECIEFLNMLFKEGLIDPESFTQDVSQYGAKCSSSDPQRVGIGSAWTMTPMVGPENADDYVELPPLKGPHGDQLWSANPIALSTTQCTWMLSASCEDKEAAIRFIDYMYDPEISAQFFFGSYGNCLQKNDDGTVTVLESGDPEVDVNSWLWINGFGDMGPYYVSKEFEEKMIPNSGVIEKLNHDAVYEAYTPDEKDIYPPMFYTPADNEELSVIKTDMNNLINQKFAQWVTGEADINAEWDDYVKSLDNVGLPRAMEIYNRYWEQSKG